MRHAHALRVWVGAGLYWWAAVGVAAAVESTTERVSDVATIEQKLGRLRLHGSGSLGAETVRLRGGAEVHHLGNSPWFVSSEARFEQERRLPYDLRHWGGHLGLGWAFSETNSLLAKYRLDHYKVFNTGPNVDPAFRTVAGRSQVAALGLDFQHDTRDDALYPTQGTRLKLGGELALEALGGDDNFSRLESDTSVYATPFQTLTSHPWLQDVTLVEHFRVGWVQSFGETDAVPFFERYFAGGSTTVRGHRNRWLTPRGLEQQFVGGEWLFVNNVELRKPILSRYFKRDLSAALFFDAGRAYRRLSALGDFGYGVGGGLRYVVRLGPIHGVARADYAFSLDHEGDDSTSRLHLTFGIPF